MKLIYIANVRMPTEKAHGLQIMKMCESFERAGKRVELLIPRRFNAIKENPFVYYGIRKKFKIRKMPSFDIIPLNLGNFGFWLQTTSFLFFTYFYLLFRRHNCGILYSREQLAGLFFKNLVLEIHSLPARIKPFHLYIWKKTRALVVLTESIKDRIAKSGVSKDKILVAPDGVDIEEFDINATKEEARQKLDLPLGKKIILYAGSFYLYNWKGVDILLEAAGNFSDDFLFVLVGGMEKEINNIRTKYPLKNTILISHRPHKEIPYYLKAADILILPNKKGEAISEEYTSPLKLFEYMASGRPIIASNLPSIKEVLNNDSALLVEPNDPEKLTEAIIKISNDKETANKMAQAAFTLSKEYTWDKRAGNTLNFIALFL